MIWRRKSQHHPKAIVLFESHNIHAYMLWQREMAYATAEGDVDRVYEMVKVNQHLRW
jgi:hypothetical protein